MKGRVIRSALVIVAIAATVIPTSATVAPAVANVAYFTNITKSFEFGPGTPNPVSNQRGFEIPSGLEVAATVKYRRLGTGKEGIPIAIELREPDTAPGVEGPIVKTETRHAYTTESSVTIRSLPSNRGCTKPWRVRVRYNGTDGVVPNAVFGTARLDWDGTTRTVSAETPGYIIKGTSKVVKIGGPTGFGEGALGITANWNHMIGPVPGGSPVKFLVQIFIDHPSGTVVSSGEEAYSSNEANATPRLSFVSRIREVLPHQYSLSFRNKDVHDAFVQTPVVKFSPTCT